MRLLDRVRQPQRAAELPEWGSYYTTTYQQTGRESVLPTFESYATDGYKSNGVVFAILLARLMLFSEAEFKYQNVATKKLWSDASLSVLERPWPGGSTGELLARMIQDADLAGNAFVRRCSDGVLERLRPDWVDIVSAADVDEFDRVIRHEVSGYIYRTDGTMDNGVFFPVGDVAHWSPIPDPTAEWRGMSWLAPVVREINADSLMTDHKKTFFKNNATPNMVIRFDQKLDDAATERLRVQWNARHGGSLNSGKTAVLDNGADLQVIGNSFEQMNFSQIQAAGENRIAAAAGVPGIVVGLKEGLQAATYSNYEQAMRRFSDLTMRPLWRSACAALSKLVDVPEDSRLTFDPSEITALRQGELERAQTFKEKSFTATELIRTGYDPATVAAAVEAGDLSLLQHTGAIPTALYPDGKQQGVTP